MKTAVPIPDESDHGAERLAGNEPDEATEAMNHAIDEAGEAKDAFVSAAARRTLDRSDW